MDKKYKRQYLWVSQEFYNLIMGKGAELKKKGFNTSATDLTHRLTPIIRDNINFDNLVPKIKWGKKKRR